MSETRPPSSRRPRLLDLFCGAGGAALGYHRAGFDVVGVDIEPQPLYPFEFHLGDAMEWQLEGYDAIHASPPCEGYSASRHLYNAIHPDLLGPTRERLEGWGGPWVIENVPGSPIRAQAMLCGTAFGLPVHRHRYFEASFPLGLVSPCNGSSVKKGQAYSYFAGVLNSRAGGVTERVWAGHAGLPWLGKHGTRKAIPPAYTEWVGGHLLAHLGAAV